MKTKLFISGLAFMALTTIAAAQSKDASSPMPQGGAGKGVFVDADKDGICDNYANNKANASGCKMSGANNSCGMGGKQMRGQGKGCGMGQGKGNGKNFVDADKNGICDNFEVAAKK